MPQFPALNQVIFPNMFCYFSITLSAFPIQISPLLASIYLYTLRRDFPLSRVFLVPLLFLSTPLTPPYAKHLVTATPLPSSRLLPVHREALRARGVAEHPQHVLGEEVAVEVPEDLADGLAVSWRELARRPGWRGKRWLRRG